jgi:hypothetical protein
MLLYGIETGRFRSGPSTLFSSTTRETYIRVEFSVILTENHLFDDTTSTPGIHLTTQTFSAITDSQ